MNRWIKVRKTGDPNSDALLKKKKEDNKNDWNWIETDKYRGYKMPKAPVNDIEFK